LDDGSNDGSAEAVEELSAKVTVLRGSGAWWWGGALDHGYRWLRLHATDMDDIVLIINDDTCASETWPGSAPAAKALNQDFGKDTQFAKVALWTQFSLYLSAAIRLCRA